MTADSAINEHSQHLPITTTASTSVSSVLSRGQSLSSPWASFVRGDSDPISSPTAAADITRSSLSLPQPIAAATEQASAFQKTPMRNSGLATQSESSDTNNDGNVGNQKRPAWNKSLNGVVDPGSVMGGAVSWPALSESTRPTPRSSDSRRPFPYGSSSSSSQGSEMSEPPQRQANTHAHTNFAANQTMPTGQRPMRHRGGGGGISPRNGPSQSGFTRPSPPVVPPFVPPYPMFDMAYRAVVPAVMDTSVRGMRSMAGIGGSQSHTSSDHYLLRNNSRRGTFGPRPRSDGQHNNHHGGRQDQDRKDIHLPHLYIPPSIGFMPSPPSPGTAQFITHPPARAFAGSVGFDMASPAVYVPTLPPETFRTMPPPPPPPLSPMLFPAIIDVPLPTLIVKQIDYYFSDTNLLNDNYLRKNMDAEGWVPISLIATFPRVQKLTANIQMILDSLRASIIVEVQGNKIRKRNEWMKWIHTSNRYNADSGSQSRGASAEKFLVKSFQNVSVDDALTNANSYATGAQMEKAQVRCLFEDVNGQIQVG